MPAKDARQSEQRPQGGAKARGMTRRWLTCSSAEKLEKSHGAVIGMCVFLDVCIYMCVCVGVSVRIQSCNFTLSERETQANVSGCAIKSIQTIL